MSAPDPDLEFVVKMALRNALKMVRGLRKQIGDREEDVMARRLLDELALSGHEIVQRPGPPAGHLFEAPKGVQEP
jgi:hypothetical protein